MKRTFIILLGCCLGLNSCYELDLNPLSQASSENWYSNETEIEMSIKDFYRDAFWPLDNEDKTDNFIYRETPSEIIKGTFNGQSGDVTTLWANQYKSIARTNTILSNMDKAADMGISEEKIKRYEAEALFQRASCYARLVTYFGDVVYVTSVVDIEEAFTLGRTPKSEIIPKIYEDYDKAAEGLPEKYTGVSSLRATKGAALALKARFALYMGDWEIAADAAYECTDGLPIDESPLFDPQNPFKNRDPRCTATIVEFGTRHLGFDYNPHPDAVEVMNYNTGKMQKNNDARVNAQFASYNGLLWKKGIDETWLENGKDVDPDKIIIRYADVLLMYAEAKIELNQIDQSVLDAINRVRARAYGVDYTNISAYPAITTTSQQKLRTIIRNERRVEFAKEGLRYMDLVRWKIAGKALTRPNYGMLYPVSLLREKIIDKGLWFWPDVPQIDEDGIPDFSAMEKAGLIAPMSQRMWNDRQYLWPIPTKEVLINENLKQNPGY